MFTTVPSTRTQPPRSCKQIKEIVPKPAVVRKQQDGKKTRTRALVKAVPNALMTLPRTNELVWAYMKGYPSWPGVVESILPNGKFLIHFFGDYILGQVTRKNITNYFEGFNQFACNFGNIKLQKAVEEAKYFLLGNLSFEKCSVCEILEYKRQLPLKLQINKN